MASGVQVHKSAVDAFNDIQKRAMHKYALFSIKKFEAEDGTLEEFQTINTAEKGEKSCTETFEDEEVEFNKMKELIIKLKAPRYIVYDFRFTTDDGVKVEKPCFIFWCPDDCASMKDKMLYASSKDYVQKAFQGVNRAHQINDCEDLNIRECLKVALKTSTIHSKFLTTL